MRPSGPDGVVLSAIGPLARDLIVQRFAQTGRWCATAERIFFGGASVAKHSGTAPGKYPVDLVRECNRARAEYLAGTFKERITFLQLPEEAA